MFSAQKRENITLNRKYFFSHGILNDKKAYLFKFYMELTLYFFPDMWYNKAKLLRELQSVVVRVVAVSAEEMPFMPAGASPLWYNVG